MYWPKKGLERKFNQKILQKFIETFSEIENQLIILEFGFVPTALNDTFLLKICSDHFKSYQGSNICRLVNIRNISTAKMDMAYLDRKGKSIVLLFKLSFPETSAISHKIYILPVYLQHALTRKSCRSSRDNLSRVHRARSKTALGEKPFSERNRARTPCSENTALVKKPG